MSGTYRYTGTTWYRNGGTEVVEHGDTLDGVTAAEKAAFGESLEPVDDGPAPEPDAGDGADGEDAAGESYECGAETDAGGTCSRTVDGPDERCWAHSED